MEQEELDQHYRRLRQELQEGGRKCWGQVDHEEGRRLYEEGGLSMARLLVELLKIEPKDTVVDLGAGPCHTAHQINKLVRLEKAVLCVDPVAELLFCGSELHNIRILQAEASQFVKMQDISYSKIYMKAIAHHIPREQWAAILEGIYSQLVPGGMLLVDTGGDTCTLPWGARGTKEYNRSHHGLQNYLECVMSSCRFKTRAYKLSIPATMDRKDLVLSYKNKYSTCFYNMTQEEIGKEVQELLEVYKEDKIRYVHERTLILAGK